MTPRLGVGVIGAGPVTQAIHIPTLATLSDRLRVVHVMDVDESVATEVAARVDAVCSTTVDSVLDDPVVEVVAICSPPQFHADQVEAACRAGKRAVMCEKPLATTPAEADRIAHVCRDSGVPLVVGTMHAYDPAYTAATQRWAAEEVQASLIRSVIHLPPNDAMVALATDIAAPHTPPRAPVDLSTPTARATRMRAAVLGLAIHNIPLVRQALPKIDSVKVARLLKPYGYLIALEGGDTSAELIGFMPGAWQPDWRFQVWGAAEELRVEFPPSYVMAGSATAELTSDGSRQVWQFAHNGYQAEWLHVAEVALGAAPLLISVERVIDDLLFALQIADAAERLVLEAPE